MNSFVVRMIAGAVLTVGLTQTVRAQDDITFGGAARAFAMGGAGIAIAPEKGGARVNPASLAYEKRDIAVSWPSLGYRALGGINLSDAGSYLMSGQDLGEAAELARQFAKKDSEFGINTYVGARFGKIEVSSYGVGTGRLLPNANLQAWANDPNAANTVPGEARADILAAGYYTLPSVSVATTLPAKSDSKHNYAVGLRLKYMNSVYTHYRAEASALNGTADAGLAPEMMGEEVLTKKGVGADLGFLMRPRKDSGITAAFIVANAIKPAFNFEGTDRDGNPKTYKLLTTTMSAGAGFQHKGTTLAADLVDITGASGDPQFRAGGEQRFFRSFAVRAGYSSAGGFTYGASIFGFDVALGRSQPLEVVRTINF